MTKENKIFMLCILEGISIAAIMGFVCWAIIVFIKEEFSELSTIPLIGALCCFAIFLGIMANRKIFESRKS